MSQEEKCHRFRPNSNVTVRRGMGRAFPRRASRAKLKPRQRSCLGWSSTKGAFPLRHERNVNRCLRDTVAGRTATDAARAGERATTCGEHRVVAYSPGARQRGGGRRAEVRSTPVNLARHATWPGGRSGRLREEWWWRVGWGPGVRGV
jgi:hypothetical protein